VRSQRGIAVQIATSVNERKALEVNNRGAYLGLSPKSARNYEYEYIPTQKSVAAKQLSVG
jgi:hypothetical protein